MAFPRKPADYPALPEKESLWNVIQLLQKTAFINHAHPGPPPPPSPKECENIATYLTAVAEWMMSHGVTFEASGRRVRQATRRRNGSTRASTRRRQSK